ncbi:MAG: PHP domain-containing protein [Christensenellaceae bacterium]|jgi:histidinol-phosphatase (PHP family)|nr:PHP domain-containing protein [Christensenellaceae bacterium]
MTDHHIHLENRPYTLEALGEFCAAGAARGLEELWLLEHCYLFAEFLPMYEGLRAANPFIDGWLHKKGGTRSLKGYLSLAEQARNAALSLRLKFGLEICYFEGQEGFVRAQTGPLALDFLLGSVHFVGDFAFDHSAELWQGRDVDEIHRGFFKTSLALAGSGLFSGLAHPDSIKIFGHRPSFDPRPHYQALARALSRGGLYAEQNSGVFRRAGGELGLSPALLAALRAENVLVFLASDAHVPKDVGACFEALAGL